MILVSILEKANKSAQELNKLQSEATAVLNDPSIKMTVLDSIKDLAPILVQAKKLSLIHI